MSPKTRQRLSAFLGLLLIVAMGYGIFIGARASFRVVAAMDSDVAVAIIAAAATIFVSILSLILGKVYEAKERIEKEIREKKIPVYEELIKFMFRVLMGSKTGDTPSEKELWDFMAGFTQRITVWGSDEVLRAWVKWRVTALDEAKVKEEPFALMFLYEQLLLTIRRDLGHANKNIKTGDILSLFINDIQLHIPQGSN